jgi:murein L,D-transpeptidase YcbB/YkuD
MRWMNPIYAGLREAIANGAGHDQAERDLLRLNLERARALPSSGRYLVVNATAAQLTMYEDGNVVDTMRVVVGKPINPTPMMAAQMRFASLNPYWNVPPDLAAERVAPAVVKEGIGYLRQKGYQLLASWDPDAKVIDPGTVDWKAVADGREEVRLRQLPGPSNAMGKMKFMFPNAQGIYLHDTPQKELLSEASRLFSGGCVRLEDASRLARWLFNGKVPTTKSARPEQRVDLPRPVPVFLTYLTAVPDGGNVAFLPDVYNRDRAALAALYGSRSLASR